MSMKGYYIEGQARNPNLTETAGSALNGQTKRRTMGSCPTPQVNMKMTRTMRSSGIPKWGAGLTCISDGALDGLGLSLLRASVLTRLKAVGCSLRL